ncbi:hypothetical protein B0T14DRAFT_520659 [Immersiella caudata]|uniref:Uncharacterized protein n=1 Tax=Immersiella caudata TaxID=314043 RepID=A0AA40C0J5_9PEZI|nr:hypothetical protein B0T14DRAFT_520659 [Immersiella caudata]
MIFLRHFQPNLALFKPPHGLYLPRLGFLSSVQDHHPKRKIMDSVARSAKALTPVISAAGTNAAQAVSPTMKKAAGVAIAGASVAAANPIAAACGVVALGGLTVVAAPAVLTAPVLSAVGFTSLGPAAGSIAAGVQGASTVAGGLFATLQSAAMGGYGAAAVAGAAQVAGGAVAAAGGAAAAVIAKK